jgi:hypothetical protein
MRLKALLDGVSSFLPPPLIFIGVDKGVSTEEIGEVTWNRHGRSCGGATLKGKVGGAQLGSAEPVVSTGEIGEVTWNRHGRSCGGAMLKGKVGGAQLGLAEPVVRPNWSWLPPPYPLAGWLPSGPLHRFSVLRAKLSQFTPSGGPMDPCACA